MNSPLIEILPISTTAFFDKFYQLRLFAVKAIIRLLFQKKFLP